MNNFSSYQGLPNLSYIVADDLDIANLEVDTITVNVELKTDNIQPLTNTSDIVIGTNTNTGIVDFQQNVDVNGDLEADNITVNTQLNTNSIQPLNSNDIITIGDNLNTGYIAVEQDIIQNGNITTNNVYANNQLFTNLITAQTSIDNLVIGDNTWTGIIDIQQDVDINGDLQADNITVNTSFKTNSIEPTVNANPVVLYSLSTGAMSLGNTASANNLTIKNNTLLDSGKNLTLSTTGILSSNIYRGVAVGDAVSLFSNSTSTNTYGNTSNTNPIRFNQNVCIGTNTNTRQLNVSNDQNTAVNNYLLLLNTAQTTRENGIQIRNQNAGVFSNEWYLYTPLNNTTDFRIYGNGADRFIFNNSGVLKLTTLTGTTTSTDFNLGETASDTGIINCYRTIAIFGGKNLNINSSNGTIYCSNFISWNGSANINFGNSLVGGSGCSIFLNANSPLYTNFVRPSGNVATSNINLYDTTTTGIISFGTGMTSGDINMMASASTGRVNIRSNLDVGTDANQKGITCAYYQAYAVGNLVRLFPTTTTGNIRLGEAQTSGNIQLGHTTPASDLGTLNINKNTVIATGKSLTFSTTSDLKVNSIQPINVGDAISLYTTSTGNITVGNGANVNNILFNQNVSLGSKKLLCLTYTSTSTSNFMNLGESGDSGLINVYRDIFIQNNKKISLGTTSTLNVNIIEPVSVADAITLYSTSTGTFNIGNNASTNKITFNQKVLMNNVALYVDGITASAPNVPMYIGETTDTSFIQVDRNLYAMKTFYTDSISAITPLVSSLGLYQNATTSDITIGSSQTTGFTTIGGTVATTGTVRLQPNTEIAFDKILYVSKLNFSNYKGSGSTVELYNDITTTGAVNIMSGQTTAHLNLGNASATTGRIKLLNPNIESGAVGTNISLYGNTTTGSVSIMGGQTTGNLNLGSASATTGRIKFLNSSIESNAVSSTTNLFNNQTTGSINFATGLTTGSLTISSALTTGKTIIGNASATPPTNDGSVQLSGVVRILNDASSFFNTDSGTNLFRTVALQGKQLTNTMWAAAPTSVFAVWESNADNEACFIAQNGDSTIISNPGDQSALWYLDEDVITTANNYAWSGFRMSTAGVITASSDRRIKRDITPIVKENLLETLSKIEIVNYKMKPPTEEQYYKNGKLRKKYQETHLGVIAQQVRESGLKEVVDRENDEAYWTVKYQDLSYYFHMGTQELIKENIALKEKVNKLENFIKSKFSDYE